MSWRGTSARPYLRLLEDARRLAGDGQQRLATQAKRRKLYLKAKS
jgi:hypothetical protein